MRFLFYFPIICERKVELSYSNLNSCGGFSGTETSVLELSKYLVDHNHSVSIVGGTRTSFVDHNINFISQHDFDFSTVASYNWYSPLFYLHDFMHHQILEHIDKDRTGVIVWLHIMTTNFDYIVDQGFRVFGVCVSDWVYRHTESRFPPGNLCVVYNGINKDIFPRRNMYFKQRGKWVFHATYERGGQVAIRAFENVATKFPLAARSFDFMSYYTPDAGHWYPPNVTFRGSQSKQAVSAILEESEYFVYPLVLPHGAVHHDTFGSVILEAISMGVIVVTWKVACIPEVYKDYVIALDPPEGYPADAPFACDNWFNSEEAVCLLANAVISIDQDTERKRIMRERGIEWARNFAWENNGQKLENFLILNYNNSVPDAHQSSE